jgi:hypothetical protein
MNILNSLFKRAGFVMALAVFAAGCVSFKPARD